MTALIEADIIQRAAEEGRTGNEIADKAVKAAQEIRAAQEQVEERIAINLGGRIPEGFQTEWIVTVEGGETQTLDTSQMSAIADRVDDTADQIREVVGGRRTKELEDGVAGYAYQGQSNSMVIDVGSAFHGHSFDVTMLQDTVDHEHEHEVQAAGWNAQFVSIGNGQILDRTTVSEVGAMSVQQSIGWVSEDYKRMFAYVLSLGITAAQARETARTGDLEALGREVRERRGIAEPEFMMAS